MQGLFGQPHQTQVTSFTQHGEGGVDHRWNPGTLTDAVHSHIVCQLHHKLKRGEGGI